MSKILAQAGISLADIYSVQGSIAGVEELLSREVSLIHEMGQTIFAERVSGTIFRASTAAISQSSTFDILTVNLPDVPTRLLGVQVFTQDDPARVSNIQVSLRNDEQGREFPVWVWDGTNTTTIRTQDDGGGVGNRFLFQPTAATRLLPNMMMGTSQPETVDDIAFRGITGAFGAGTITIVALYYVAFAEEAQSGVSSFGLPIPGW